MKVIGIVSSPSKEGNTATLVREALKAASEQGAETEEIFLYDKKIEFCQGCFNCMETGKCPIDDDFESIKEKLNQCDGIVIGSPTYGLDFNAIMKNFFDRIGMFSVYTSFLAGKYIVGFSTAGFFGSHKVAKKLTSLVESFWDRGYVTGSMGVVRGWQRVDEMPEVLTRAGDLGRKLVGDIRHKPTYPLQNIVDRTVTKVFVQNAIRQNVIENKDGKMKAVYEILSSRGVIDEDREPSLIDKLQIQNRMNQVVKPVLSVLWAQ